MACPIHIWVPLMAAAAPMTRIVRDRLHAMRPSKDPVEDAPREMKRWAPVGQKPAETTEANS